MFPSLAVGILHGHVYASWNLDGINVILLHAYTHDMSAEGAMQCFSPGMHASRKDKLLGTSYSTGCSPVQPGSLRF